MKRIIAGFIVLLTLVMGSCTALAAPDTLSPYASSSSSNLVVITNPPSFSTTAQKGVVFCGYGSKGTKVSFYKYDLSSGYYKKISGAGSVTINSSGVFWKKIDFSDGNHKVIIYAENNGAVQIVKRQITVNNASLSDKLKDYTVNIKTYR